MQERFEKEGFSYQFTILLNRKLVDWLIDHIGRVDQKFGDFVKEGVITKISAGKFYGFITYYVYGCNRKHGIRSLKDDTAAV